MRFGLRELIFFAVLLAVPVASFIYLFQPRNEDIHQTREEIKVKQAKLERLHEASAKIKDLGVAIEEGRRAIDVIEDKLPPQQDVEQILEQVWQLAKGNHLVIKRVSSQKSVPAALYMERPLEVEMEGSFDGFYQFMLELENLPRITRVHNMSLERYDRKSKKDQSGSTMVAEFTLSIYYQPK